MNPMTKISKSLIAATLVMGVTAASTAPAGAVSFAVQLACASDYYSHCSAYSVGSPAVRQCMRAVGPNLSKSCISALIGAGEVSKTEVLRYKASLKR